MCGKLDFWLYGFRPGAAAWEQLYPSKLEEVGFVRGMSCGVVFYHPKRDISLAVHGDDFTFCALEEDLLWIKDLMPKWFDVKFRGMLGRDKKDDKEVVILGRNLKFWAQLGPFGALGPAGLAQAQKSKPSSASRENARSAWAFWFPVLSYKW